MAVSIMLLSIYVVKGFAPTRFLTLNDGTRRPAPGLAQRRRQRRGKAFSLLGREETGDRKLAPARHQKQFQQAELLVGFAVELGPQRVERPFGNLAAVADAAKAKLRRRYRDLLERRRRAVIGAERP